MRITKLLLLLLSGLTTFAQLDHLDDHKNVGKINAVKLGSHMLGYSNVINAGMASDFLFSSGFANRHKQAFLDNGQGQFLFHSNVGGSLDYYINDSSGAFKISLGLSTENFAQLNKDLASLLIFGNNAFAGEEVSSSSSSWLNYRRYDLKLSKAQKLNEHWNAIWTGGLLFVNDLDLMQARNISIFTHEEGEYLDLAIQDANWMGSNAGGMGFSFGLSLQRQWEQGDKLTLEVSDLSMLFTSESTVYEIDTSFRFDGIALSPDVLFNGDIEDAVDSTLGIYIDTSFRNQFIFLPLKLSMTYRKPLTRDHSIILSADYINMGNYAVRGTLTHQYSRKNWKLNSSIQYGNYSSVVWSESFEYSKESFGVHIGFVGLNSFLAPTQTSSYGVFLGLSKDL